MISLIMIQGFGVHDPAAPQREIIGRISEHEVARHVVFKRQIAAQPDNKIHRGLQQTDPQRDRDNTLSHQINDMGS
jgi:hypothetical protein